MHSLGFYLVVAAIASGSMYWAQKRDQKILILIPIILLTLVAGLRSECVGVDTAANAEAFWACHDHGFQFVTKEHLFYWLAACILRVIPHASAVFCFYALVIYGLFFLRLWDFRKNADLSVASAVFMLFYFGGSMNVLRQYIAMAFIFYGTRYLQKKQYGRFLVFLILAINFHVSAVVALGLIVIYAVLQMKRSRKQILGLGILVLLMLPVAAFVVHQYAGYLAHASGSGLGAFSGERVDRILMVLVPYGFYMASYRKRKKQGLPVPQEEFRMFQFFFLASLLGHLMGFGNALVEFASRLGYYFRIFEVIYFGMVFHSDLVDKHVKIVIAVLILYFGTGNLLNYYGIIPYRTVLLQ